MALVGQRTDKVNYWRNSDQKQRWLGAALLDIEPRLRKVKGYRYLPQLRGSIQREIERQTVKEKQTKEAAEGTTDIRIELRKVIVGGNGEIIFTGATIKFQLKIGLTPLNNELLIMVVRVKRSI